MIYGKLPVVFLSTLASEKSGTTNHVIAEYLVNHTDEAKELGIREMAEKCHVGTGSVSRFCKDIGLQDFAELKEILKSSADSFDLCSPGKSAGARAADYGKRVKQSIDLVTKSLSAENLTDLCGDLKRYEKIALFGLLKAQSAAVHLQGDLWMMGKHAYTNVSYDQQMAYIRQAGNDSLILIFSYTGGYFESCKETLFSGRNKNQWPKIWMISGRQKSYSEYVARVLEFESLQDQAGHPYQLLYAAGLIAQEYASFDETQ